MSRYRFDVATPADDADLRRVLAETPMGGHIAIGSRREPSYFQAAAVEGPFRQVIAAYDCQSGSVVGFGSRSIAMRYVNGRPEPIGYLSSLRILAGHRNHGLLARGYAYLHRLHGDGRTRLYLTTIAAGNDAALRTLTSGRAGLPRYYAAGEYHTLAIPLAVRFNGRKPDGGIHVRPAEHADLPAILSFLNTEGPRRQFFPCYEAADFFEHAGVLRDLQPYDLLLAWRGDEIVGTLGAWDQHHFRQNVVSAYSRPLQWARPFYNALAGMRGRPRLPARQQPFRYRVAVLPLIAHDNPAVFTTLLRSLIMRHTAGPADHLLLGLHQADPLLPAARQFQSACYTTRLFLACWDDGESLRSELDGRVPYLELGCL